MTQDDLDRDDVIWAAWRRTEDGRIRTALTVQSAEGLRREQREYPDLEAATAELGESFREVVEKVREAGGDRGRWRP